MTSNDNQQYVTVELYNAGNDRLERHIIQLGEKMDASSRENKSEFQRVKAEIQAVRENTITNGAKIDAYRDFTSIWFTVITIIIGFVGLVAPLLRDIYKDAKQSKRIDDMEEIARKIMREEIREAVRENMRASGVIGK
ncbi:MAG: hypothetical protein IJG39_08440 [Synergistaceae bacterium]|nr:hypothetical protein [Synergistaceae bacterium]